VYTRQQVSLRVPLGLPAVTKLALLLLLAGGGAAGVGLRALLRVRRAHTHRHTTKRLPA
jgi:hypothetical protein